MSARSARRKKKNAHQQHHCARRRRRVAVGLGSARQAGVAASEYVRKDDGVEEGVA